MNRRCTFFAAALSSLLIPAQSFSQDSSTAAFSERIDVELVTVDVWVTDKDGAPVTGLAPEAFEILHDGDPVSLTHFTEIRGGVVHGEPMLDAEGGSAAVPAAGELETAVPGHVVVYFDQSRLHPRNYPTVIEGLESFLDEGQIAPERVLVLSQMQGLTVEAPFGSSKRDLKAALNRLSGTASSGLALESETELALEAIRDSWEQVQDAIGSASSGLAAVPGAGEPGGGGGGFGSVGGPRAVVGGVGSGAGPDACGMFPGQIQPIIAGFARSQGQRIAISLSHLFDTASFVAGLPGVKTILYLSDGLDTQPGSALTTYASSLCPAGAAELLSGSLSEELTKSFLDLTRHANANRVTIHAIQASGLRSPDVSNASRSRRERVGGRRSRGAFEASQRASERSGLGLIAGETGGRTVVNRNAFGPELIKIGEDLGSYYSLAYRPPAGDEGREHRIEVRLGDETLAARYRRGYVEKDDRQRLTERIEGALNLGITDNPLGVRLAAGGEQDAGEGTFHLPLHVMVPVEGLVFLPSGDSHVAEVTVRTMSRNATSGTVTLHDQAYRVKGAPGATGFANLAIQLTLDSGNHVTAIGIRDEATGESSFISTVLPVGSGG